jgi:CRISPR-associated protein Csd1
MLLQKLVEYSERPSFEMPPPLYSKLAVRYILDLDKDGRFLGITDTADPSSPQTRSGQIRAVPEVLRTSKSFAFLMCDVAGYALGMASPKDKADRIAANHQLFIELTRECAERTKEPAVEAVLKFLDEGKAGLQVPSDFDLKGRIVFRVDGVFPIELQSTQEYWQVANDLSSDLVTNCVICGNKKNIPRKLPSIVKGVPGGQAGGTYILFVNDGSFDSYGLNTAISAPICLACSERFTKAASDLLGSRQSSTRLADAAFIYWTREPVDFDLMAMFTDPASDDNSALFETIWSGRPMPKIDPIRFYATVLTSSGGRAVVRDWIDTTVGEVKEKLAQWFQRQAVVDAYGEEHRPLGLAALAGATVRQLSDVPRPTTRSLLHAALTGTPLPQDLLYQAVRRNRAEQTVTRPRAALIKLVLCSQPENKDWEESMIQLDQENPNPAYRCGRLLAVLEQVQRLAIPGVNATVVDRFFGTASSAPAAVFPRLLRGAQPHLSKLERDRRGAYVALQRRLEEILGGLGVTKAGALYSGFPSTLTLQEQGLFSLGYYHQRAFDRAQAIAAAGRRRAGSVEEPEAELASDAEPPARD